MVWQFVHAEEEEMGMERRSKVKGQSVVGWVGWRAGDFEFFCLAKKEKEKEKK